MPADRLPYAHLNLRRNPFGELDLDSRAELAVADVAELVLKLATPGQVVQLLGEGGRGKTTLLLALRAHFPGTPYVKIREGERPRIPRSDPLFLDDVQLLSPRKRRRVFRRRVSFAIVSHVDLQAELEALGLRVTSVWPAARLDAAVLQRVFGLRVEAARRGPGRVPRVSRDTVLKLIKRHGGNVRAMELTLYEAVQRMKEVGDVEV
jgi:hypothetical protein